MRILFHDFETFSEIDIRKVGLYKYANHPSTEIICLSWAYTTGEPYLWTPRDSSFPLKDVMSFQFHAWNAEFEFAIWNMVGVKKYGFPKTELSQYQCTMALAAMHGYPLNLDNAGNATNVDIKKDKRGSYLINKLSKPRKPSKSNPDTRWTFETAKQDYLDMYEYCKQDVRSERAIHNILPFNNLLGNEQRVWLENARLNRKGVPIDLDSVNLIIKTLEEFEQTKLKELKDLTNGKILKIGQTAKIVEWINKHSELNEQLSNLQIGTVENWLDNKNLPKSVKQILTIRKLLAKTSVKKFYKMRDAVNADSRIRDNLFYYGSHTGRFSGKNLQLQNLPTVTVDDPEWILYIMKTKGLKGLQTFYDDIMLLGSSLIRPMICTNKNKIFRIGDLKSIENIGVCWLAGDTMAIKRFKQQLDQYIDMATFIYGVPYDEVTKEQRGVGKQVVLGCGYGLGAAGFVRTAAQYGQNFSIEEAEILVNLYRKKYSLVKSLWYNTYNAAKECLREGYSTSYLNITFHKLDHFLLMQLPSGRYIIYPEAKIAPQQAPWDSEQEIDSIWYSTYIHGAGGWVSQPMSPGHMTENAVQGLCRDILVEAKLRLIDAGYTIIFHVHDEIVSEDYINFGSLTEFNSIVENTNAKTYPNFPVIIESFEAKRYRKD